MTKKLAETLGIPSLEELRLEAEQVDIDLEEETEVEEIKNVPMSLKDKVQDLISHHEMKAANHGKAMDEIHDTVLDHANKVADLGFDMDPARAPRMFEVANQLYKTAIDAKHSKRDAELKLFKLIQDERKLQIDEARAKGEMGLPGDIGAQVVVVEDRNAILARLSEQAKKDD